MAPLIALGISLVPDLLRVVAGDRAGRTAEAVGQVVQEVTGADDVDAARAALGADPAKVADLRFRLAQLGIDAAVHAREAEVEELRLQLLDLSSARARDVEIRAKGRRRWMPVALVAVAALGAAGLVVALTVGPVKEGGAAQAALIAVLTALVGILATAANFEWGSSRGSEKKTDLMAGVPAGPLAPGRDRP